MDFLQSTGVAVRNAVLFVASGLRDPAAPGVITLVLLCALAASVVSFWLRNGSRVAAMRWLDKLVRQYPDDAALSGSLETLKAQVFEEARGRDRAKVAANWREFAETLIPQDDDGRTIYHNSVRPSTFFNLDDMGFGPGFWRHAPGLFVSVGLFLTFLGLVSALNSMVPEGGGTIGPSEMNDLLTVASAKFIMSLTGLLCSILFTVVLRHGLHRAEDTAHRLSDGLEERLAFLSLEALAAKQLKSMREQETLLKNFATELVAELGRPLKDMPAMISESIGENLRPLLDQVGKAGTDGVGTLVQDLSSRMSEDVSRALGKASDSISEAGDRIAKLSDRMDQSSSKVGDELNVALARVSEAVASIRDTLGDAARDTGGAFNAGAEKLLGVMNQTLEGIRDNTSQGAEALSAAAASLRQAGEGFGKQIEDAGRTGAEAASRELSRVTSDATEKAASEVLAPLDAIAEKIEAVTRQVAAAGNDMRLFADGVKAGADASVVASNAFRAASQELTSAAAPIRSSIGSVEASVSALADATQNVATTVSRSAESTARAAADALSSAQAVLGSEQQAIENALEGIQVALQRLREQGDRIDDIDGKLGRAFEIYTQQVSGAVDGMRQHVQELQEKLQPGIDTLKTVVETAEEFIPRSRTR
ncbi:MAG TPA: hypothetical protein VIL88_15655 [Devosia sp.]|uniref:hypothetical protein n=1 Tax=Devosia sp. TaxID=1871048 RepID=UPI002F938DF0